MRQDRPGAGCIHQATRTTFLSAGGRSLQAAGARKGRGYGDATARPWTPAEARPHPESVDSASFLRPALCIRPAHARRVAGVPTKSAGLVAMWSSEELVGASLQVGSGEFKDLGVPHQSEDLQEQQLHH